MSSKQQTHVWIKKSILLDAFELSEDARKYKDKDNDWGWCRAVLVKGNMNLQDDLTLRVEDEDLVVTPKEVFISKDLILNETESSLTNDSSKVIVIANIFNESNGFLPPDNLMSLTHLHEPALVYSLKRRFAAGQIHTTTGNILLIVNPFQQLEELYSSVTIHKYMKQGDVKNGNPDNVLPLHVFSFADEVYKNMSAKLIMSKTSSKISCDQCVLISGESGAGKTVTTKHLMTYLSYVSQNQNIIKSPKNKNVDQPPHPTNYSKSSGIDELNVNDDTVIDCKHGGSHEASIYDDSINSDDFSFNLENVISDDVKQSMDTTSTVPFQMVLKSNPILESFGNARTVKNDNSSRFGKFIELQFEGLGALVGANIDTFLLEKIRLVHQAEGERNYHIFYELLSALNSEDRKKYFLKDFTAKDFHITNQSGIYDRRDMVDDVEQFNLLLISMNEIGFNCKLQGQFFSIVSSLLHASNVSFSASNSEESNLDLDNPHLKHVIDLLGLNESSFNDALCAIYIKVGKERHRKVQPKNKAEKGLEALIKAIYSALFNQIVAEINATNACKKRGKDDVTSFIGVLDVFGFESFRINSLEQLFINYCNEVLQQQFNAFIFRLEQDMYQREGIDWSLIEFPDNQDVLDLIEKKKTGLISILDDHCNAPGTTDQTFASLLYQKCKYHTRFEANFLQMGKRRFGIKHYAGSVEYDTMNFLEKNRDETPREITELLKSSSKLFVRTLLKQNKESVTISSSARSFKAHQITEGVKFKTQLKYLRQKIDKSTPHYVRCLKPNNDRIAGKFNSKIVSTQLQSAGVLEAIRLSCVGYPKRFLHSEFLKRYELLDLGEMIAAKRKKVISKHRCEILVKSISAGVFNKLKMSVHGIQMGKTKVFLWQKHFDQLEYHRNDKMTNSVIILQSQIRRFISRSNYQHLKSAIFIALWCQKVHRGRTIRDKYPIDCVVKTVKLDTMAIGFRKKGKEILSMESDNRNLKQQTNQLIISSLEEPRNHINGMQGKSENIENILNELESLKTQVKKIQGESFKGKKGEENLIKYNQDTFTFLMTDPCSFPSFVAILIFGVQIVCFGLVTFFLLDPPSDTLVFKNANPLNVPKGVDEIVLTAQGIAIVLILLVQQSLWESTKNLSNGYKECLQQKMEIKHHHWLFSNYLRLFEGFAATIATFLIIIGSDNVKDLFKDFTAITFISSFDNTVYLLAEMGIFGESLYKATRKNRDIDNCINSDPQGRSISIIQDKKESVFNNNFLQKFIFHPVIFATSILLVMFTIWIKLVLIANNNGVYLCQSIRVQLDDNVNSELMFYSGSYSLLTGKDSRGHYPAYRESKIGYEGTKNNMEVPMIIRFCKNHDSWVFALEKDYNHDDECSDKFILIRSDVVENQKKYNLFEVSRDDFSVKSDDDRWMPLGDLFIRCNDKRNDATILMNSRFQCNELRIDEREGTFFSTREWSTSYELVSSNGNPLLVYDRPIFESKIENEDKSDLIMFLGKRWIITSRNYFTDIGNNSIVTYLEKSFHGKWSNYEVAFFSETVTIDTSQDLMSPVGLKWFVASPKIAGKTQFADENRNVKSLFLCANCNNETNPCEYDGVCQEDTSCDCKKGSSGTLCQVLPSGNGLCDEYFNRPEFSFDGGDCCINSCVSSDDYKCGMDKSTMFFVGYDICRQQKNADCWEESVSFSGLSDLVVGSVSLSATGRNLAIIDSIRKTVRVFDIDGSNWITRETASTIEADPFSDTVELMGSEDMISNEDLLSPVTLAVKRISSVDIYDWKEGLWDEKNNITKQSFTMQVLKMELRNNGNSLGVMYGDSSFHLFERIHRSQPWSETLIHLGNETNRYNFSVLSHDGNMIAMGNKTCLNLYDVKQGEIKICEEVQAKSIHEVDISPNGQQLAILTGVDDDTKGEVVRYNIDNFTLSKTNEIALRVVSAIDTKIAISNDGETIFTHSVTDNLFQVYKLQNKRWERTTNIECKKAALSSSQQVLAVTSPSSEATKVFHCYGNCGDGSFMLRLTLVTDNFAQELLWEIVKLSTNGIIDVLKSGGPYETAGSMIVEEMCVSDSDDCIGIRIYDLGLDGLKAPGRIGISVNGTIIWRRIGSNISNGYQSIFPVFGDSKCTDAFKTLDNEDQYRVSLHKECLSRRCQWDKIGSFDSYPQGSPFSYGWDLSLSADGLVVAVSRKSMKLVQVFRYYSGKWVQYGSNITHGEGTVDKFGWSVSLSADGSTVAISEFFTLYEINGFPKSQGKVLVFEYYEEDSDWRLRGNIIGGSIAENIGESVSISADGSVVGISDTNSSTYCQAYLYSYVEGKNEWVQLGGCLETEKNAARSYIKLSSTGLVAAIIFGDHLCWKFCAVKVFEFNTFTETWHQRGKSIPTTIVSITPWSITISSDGSVLAFGEELNEYVRVYEYKKEASGDEWKQKGHKIYLDLPSILPYIAFPLSISLSSDGYNLAVTYENTIRILSFDPETNNWLDSLVTIPGHVGDFVFFEGISMSTTRLEISADATTIAVRAAGSKVNIYRLIKNTDICGENGVHFNFEIVPDQFPEDISWFLWNMKGERLNGGKLPTTSPNEYGVQLLNFRECLEKNEFYYFTIEDDYQDGICCDWGEGIFNVTWNNELVLNSDEIHFKKNASLCLPPSPDIILLIVTIVDFKSGMAFKMLDSKNEVIIEKVGNEDDGRNETIKQCIDIKECYTLRFWNCDGFSVVRNNSIIHGSFNKEKLEVIEIGHCKRSFCSTNNTLFELDFMAEDYKFSFSWVLMHSNNTILAQGGPYHKYFHYYYHKECISTTAIECATLRLIDNYADEISYYVLSLDGKIIRSSSQMSLLETVNIGDCSVQTCLENHTLFELDHRTDFNPEGFSWELLAYNNTILSEGGNYIGIYHYYYHNECILTTDFECATIQLFDKFFGDGERYFAFSLDGKIIRSGYQVLSLEETINIDDCNVDRCLETHTFFKMNIMTDDVPREFAWKFLASNNMILVEGGHYLERNHHYYHYKCLLTTAVECATLRLIDSSGDGGTAYSFTLDGEIVKSGTQGSFSERINVGNCSIKSCLENHTLFVMDVMTDYFPDKFSWKLMDFDKILFSGGYYMFWNHYYYHYKCISTTAIECATLQLYDSFDGGGTYYVIQLDGVNISEGIQFPSENPEFQLGNCSN